ncbi:MAG TPA: formylmethanofuran dehydrogenase subunit A [Pirellulales bacterium]|nr:formylmethanofuran dehydrogenase subunit A [Pirellulales bacterium]
MSNGLLKIAGGTVYDPTNGIDGLVRDLWIEGGKIVAAPADPAARPAKVIDARGLIVMPGGIDMHCHIAGPKTNAARRFRPEENRTAPPVYRTVATHSGTGGSVPSTFATGYRYAGLGYTTAFDAAITPLAARHAHAELADTPCIDRGFYVLVGNNHYLLDALGAREPERVEAFLGWLLSATKAYAPKLVNPGGVEAWKHGSTLHSLDDSVPGFRTTPREILQEVARAGSRLKLPHSVHVHTPNLGLPGNWSTTLAAMQAVEPFGGHLTHIQFHSYGGDDEASLCSSVAPLADFVNAHPRLTVDVGQVMFGNTTSMTGDSQVGYYLSNIHGTKWVSHDTELETGCGITPIRYKQNSVINAWQWAIGLEWYLLVDDPWRVVMSTDHPNGGSFLAYPQIIRLLMDRTFRREQLALLPRQVRQRSVLNEIEREYSLEEICIITRSGPARILGLKNKGHLGPGADADLTIYTPHKNQQTMFELPRYVIKAGETLMADGELHEPAAGKTLHVAPEFDRSIETDLSRHFERYYSVRLANYSLTAEEIGAAEATDCQ